MVDSVKVDTHLQPQHGSRHVFSCDALGVAVASDFVEGGTPRERFVSAAA